MLTVVSSLALPGVLVAQNADIRGTVFDSIAGQPLDDAAVVLWETPYRGVSDAEGRYVIEDVPPGRYNLIFFHTRLGELGISPGPRIIEIREEHGAGELEVHLATPSIGTVVTSACLLESPPAGSGAVGGWVRDGESGLRLSGSAVDFTWGGDDSNVPDRLAMTTGPGGWYYTCSAPSDVPMLASARYYGREARRREVSASGDTFTEVDFSLFPFGGSRVAGVLRDATSGEGVRGAEVWLRGTELRVLSDGRGEFDLGDVLPGTYMLMTDHLVYGTKMDTLEVAGDADLSVEMRLDTRPIPIAPITVSVDAPAPISAGIPGGIVITPAQIEEVRQRSRDASDVIRSLHVPGVIVRHQSNGTICVGYSTGQVKMNQTGCVEMLIYINDVRATDPDLALRLPPDAIERMVIYKPVEAGNLFGLGGGNGVWMIYTR